MNFAPPWVLLAGLLVLPFFWWVRRSRAPLPAAGRWSVAGLQALAWLLAVAALAGPWRAGRGVVHRVAVWAADDEQARSEIEAWRDAVPHAEPFHVVRAGIAPRIGNPGADELPAAAGTPDLAAALRAAIASVPVGATGVLTLWTDGRHEGDPLPALAAELSARGIPLHVRPLTPPALTGPVLCGVSHPPCVAPGEAFRLVASVRAPAGGPARLEVRQGHELLGAAEVVLRAGEQRVPLDLVLRVPGISVLEVLLRSGPGGGVAGGARQERSALLVEAPLPLLHLTAEPSRRQALAATLANHGFAVQAPDPTQPLPAGWIQEHAAVLVDDLAADAWPQQSQAAIASAVATHGVGLLLAGTHANLGPGGYGSSPLVPILPVRMPQREERRDPSVALVIILDTSGSMGGGRIELAKEVARLAIKSLLPHDKVGIVEFYGSKRWAAPLQPATNTIEITRALNRLQAGGGTIIYEALEEAHFALLNARTRFQHILVLTDGGVESGPFEALARRMASAGQNLSTVLIGPQANSPFLLSLAQWGRGRFYACPDRFQLPELQFREPQSALLPAVQERSLQVTRSAEAEAVAAFGSDDLPPTGGLVEASVRPGAEVLLRASGAPYLVGWDQGQGRALVLAGQALGPQTGVLHDDPAYGAFLADVLRSAAAGRRAQGPALTLRAQERGLWATVVMPDTLPLPAAATVAVLGAAEVALLPYRGRELRAFVPWLHATPQTVEVRSQGKVLARGAACPPEPRGERAGDASAELLRIAQLTGGTLRAGAVPATSVEPRSMSPQVEPLAPLCLLLALASFLLALFVRRAPFERLRRPAVVALAIFLWAAGGPTLMAQVPAGEDAAIQAAIQAELRTTGDLAGLTARWQQASPRHRLQLALARGDLALAAQLCADPALRQSHGLLRARLLAVRGQAKEALAAYLELGDPTAATPVERGEWLATRAMLRHATGDVAGATADLRAAVAAAALPAFTDRVGLLAGALGLVPLALEWHQAAAAGGKSAFHAALRRGVWCERAGDAAAASREYEAALGVAELQRDRTYALSQVVSVARRAGSLPELASRWLLRARGQAPALAPDELGALIEVLRELGRPGEARAVVEALPPAARVPLEGLAVDLALEAGEAEVAVRQLQARLLAHPEDAALRSHAAFLLVDLHQEEAAARLIASRAAAAGRRELRLLGQTASELGMDDVVVAVAGRLAEQGEPGDRTDAALLEIAHLRRRQRTPAAIARALQARTTATRPVDRVKVADQLESLGQAEACSAMLAALFEETQAEDLGMRLAWMLSESKREADRKRAVEIFRRVWLSAGSAARRVQAEDHVLDLAAREGTLADLAIELEGQLADPKTPNRPAVRDALVKIHARARDTVGAVAILRQWTREEPAQEVAALEQMARVHLAADEYRSYDRTLRQLIARNPEGELDYRQQLAVGALERGRPAEARQCIQELIGKPGVPDLQALEFAAGVYTLAAQHEDAVRLYRRTLALHPERVETWLLLGNALRAANQRELAVGLYQSILLQEPPDDLFVVAVDGLLNMEAGKPALEAAAQLVQRRMMARPDQVFLHRLTQDLLESLGQPQARLRSIADCVVVAGEQRLSFVRELLQEAETRRDWREYAAHGRTLLLMGDEVPPAVFISLGEALLRNGEFDAAARAFARARLANDFGAVEARIAGLYEKAGRLQEAERMRRQILRRAPDDAAAILATARVCEQQGADDRALPLYLRAAKLLLPAELAASRPARPGAGMSRLPVPLAANRNREADGPGFAEAFSGCLRSATEPLALAPLLQELDQVFAREPGPSPDQQLSLLQWLRHLALATANDAIAADAGAREDALLKARPDDDRIRKAVLSLRMDAGEYDAALRLATPGEPGWEQLRLLVHGGDAAALAAAAARAPVDLLPDLARLLVLAGRRAETDALAARLSALAQQDPDGAGRAWLRLRQTLGQPVDEGALVQHQLDKALASTQPPARRVPALLTALRAHRTLPPEERQKHLLTLALTVVETKDQTLVTRMLDEAADVLPAEQVAALVELLFNDASKRPFMIANQARYLRRLDPERAQTLLLECLRRLTPEDRRTQTLRILQLEGQNLPEPLTLALVRGLDLSKLGLADRYPLMQLATRETLPPAVMAVLAERLKTGDPDDAVAVLVQVRVAPADQRGAAAERAVLALGQRAELEGVVNSTLDEIVGLVPAAACEGLLGKLPERAPAPLRAALLRRAGRPVDGARQLAAAAERRPDDMGLLLQATRLLEQHGEWEAALRLFRLARQQGGRFYPHQAQQLARLELRAGQPLAALDALQGADDPALTNFNHYLRVLAAIPDEKVRQPVLRRLLQDRSGRPGRAGSIVLPMATGRPDGADTLAAALVRPTLPVPGVPRLGTGDEGAEAGLDLLALVPEGVVLAKALRRQTPPGSRGEDLALDRVLVVAAQRAGQTEALVADAVARLATRPHDPDAQRLVMAAAQLGVAVPGDALRSGLLHRLSVRPLDSGQLIDALTIAQGAGDAETAGRILDVLLADRTLLRGVRLRNAVPGLLSLLQPDRAAALLRLAPATGADVDEALDSELLAALLATDAEASAVVQAWRPAVEEWFRRDRERVLQTGGLRLAWCGALLASGDVSGALAILRAESGRTGVTGALPATHLFGAAIPPLGRWQAPDQAAAMADGLILGGESGAEDRRGVSLRLAGVLAARLKAAGQDAAAAALSHRLRSAAQGLAIQVEAWVPGA